MNSQLSFFTAQSSCLHGVRKHRSAQGSNNNSKSCLETKIQLLLRAYKSPKQNLTDWVWSEKEARVSKVKMVRRRQMLTKTMCKEFSSQLIHSQSCQVSLHFTPLLLPCYHPSLLQNKDLAIKPGTYSSTIYILYWET